MKDTQISLEDIWLSVQANWEWECLYSCSKVSHSVASMLQGQLSPVVQVIILIKHRKRIALPKCITWAFDLLNSMPREPQTVWNHGRRLGGSFPHRSFHPNCSPYIIAPPLGAIIGGETPFNWKPFPPHIKIVHRAGHNQMGAQWKTKAQPPIPFATVSHHFGLPLEHYWEKLCTKRRTVLCIFCNVQFVTMRSLNNWHRILIDDDDTLIKVMLPVCLHKYNFFQNLQVATARSVHICNNPGRTIVIHFVHAVLF